jgi:hypothetical protein
VTLYDTVDTALCDIFDGHLKDGCVLFFATFVFFFLAGLSYFILAKTDFLYFKPFLSGPNGLPPFHSGLNLVDSFQAISFRPKSTSSIPVSPKPIQSIPSHSIPAKTDFLYSKIFRSGQNRFSLFQAIPVGIKPTSSIPSHSIQAKTDFLHFKPFHSGQNQLSLFQAIAFQPKPTSFTSKPYSQAKPIFFIPSHSSLDKSVFFHSKLFQSSQNRLLPFQAMPVRLILAINPLTSRQAKTFFLYSKPFE